MKSSKPLRMIVMLTDGIPVELRSNKSVSRTRDFDEGMYIYYDDETTKELLVVNKNSLMCEITEAQIENLKQAGNDDRTLDTCPAITNEEIDNLLKED